MIGEQSWREVREEEHKSDKGVAYVVLSLLGIILLLCLLFGGCVDSVGKTQEGRARTAKVELTPEQQQFKQFFANHGSPEPEAMAVAVTATKRPALMGAIAVKESNGNPKAIGDGGDSKGAWQVQKKHWGEVPNDAVGQALQAERILEELLSSRRSLRSGLARYNGGTRPARISYRYADHVMRIERSLR